MTHRGFTLTQLILGLAAVAIIATAIIFTAQRLGDRPTSTANRNTTINTNARTTNNTNASGRVNTPANADTSNANVSGNTNEQVYCTADAKLCPDGSYVGRVAPDCAFALCP